MSVFNPPDWRDAEAYPAEAGDWLLDQWVWAFLRRNPDYQKDYAHFASLPSYHTNGNKTVKWSGTRAQWWEDPELRYCKQSLLPDEDTIAEYFQRTNDNTPFYYSLEDHLIEKWEINDLEDPASDAGSRSIMFEIPLPKVIEDYRFDYKICEYVPVEVEPAEYHEITLRFDLRYSIDKQLSFAKDHLMACKKSVKKIPKEGINREFFPKYLRAYDAYQAGAKNIEIAYFLWPERKIVLDKSIYDTDNSKDSSEQLAQRATTKGRELVMGGYKKLLRIL